jgi:hypothetical protein
MKVDRRSFFAGAAALGATAPLGGLADEAQGASSVIRSHGFFARRKYDHVVVGGGFAGVAAALASARAGAKTCLLERTNVLGGLSTQGHIIVFMPLSPTPSFLSRSSMLSEWHPILMSYFSCSGSIKSITSINWNTSEFPGSTSPLSAVNEL